MRRFTFLVLPIVLLFAGAQAQAATIPVGSAGALGADDFFDWGAQATLPQGTAVASPVAVTSDGGRAGTIDDGAGGMFTHLVEGTDWIGNFTVGDNVLYTGDASDADPFSDSFTMTFATAVAGLGLQIHSNFTGAFTASLEVFNAANVSLGVFGVSGVNDGNEDGTAPFLGALSDAVDISSAVFSLTSNGGAGLGVNRLLTTDTPFNNQPQAVPEPATLGLVGMGALAMLRRRRQRR